MLRMIAMGVLILSVILLGLVVFRKKLGFGWLSLFGVHLVLAALGIYVVNFSGLLTQVYIPLNPATIGAVTVLGLPGVVMLLGLRIILF
ncbi:MULTISPECIES: pro-sigmaK processing inhibitor BofA family protein [Paenibacillus]|jgi:inhibitor of the pro-sigma K processing machinery|uniref:Pro-sigmaK processing inhibitor BofA n=2 Tax=Paenibacillus TaxID=44249 RepID=A0A1R0WYG0_9BACL|nr:MULTISPECIES: pro-sigmaK processing inhibitor BofA family protein [Paenibacillus]AIQ71916.1 pro-sigmaK processing inhibitor BofA [Paenibacillus odorifer]MDH6431483.1 inhibitor of the pro-sigma K processing machinery [Paenibacillus sp. PastH-4]MDH6447507.1 inhibitor of the pro-sigma K processing machinery [Paenibacillus sp. PastF-4]MDH6531696.1 inhibitor of the pro-sigma K processing machinery [Paenibacillus sp. PastH-3]OMC65015.1 pro-sigmaK processing inhibitor BofA [Paenibacillus odorifer]